MPVDVCSRSVVSMSASIPSLVSLSASLHVLLISASSLLSSLDTEPATIDYRIVSSALVLLERVDKFTDIIKEPLQFLILFYLYLLV